MRDLYDVSISDLETIRDEALEAGARGVKISGVGMGVLYSSWSRARKKGLKLFTALDMLREDGELFQLMGVRIDKRENQLNKIESA